MKQFSSGMTLKSALLGTDELLIKSAGLSEPQYTTLALLLAQAGGSNCKETTIRLYQSGTNAPSEQFTFADEIRVENPLDPFSPKRWVAFGRTGVGTYNVRIYFTADSPEAINGSNVAVSFSDNKCQVYQSSSGAVGNNHYAEWVFKSYSPLGDLVDGLITWTNITLKLYK